ncbi:hypothetical protein ACX0G9_02290 [Flavitalea flava]
MKIFNYLFFRLPMWPLACLGIGGVFLPACHKTGNITDIPDSPISFYNASEYLRSHLEDPTGTGYYAAFGYILIDTPDTVTRPDGSALSIAAFNNYSQNTYQFPNLGFYYEGYSSNQKQTWISYMRILSGLHTVVLTDTGGLRPLAYNRIATTQGSPMTIYYADSLGVFRSWPLLDAPVVADNTIGIRVLDLSPDAGNLFFTIGGKLATGFPDSLQYGRISDFVPWPNPVSDTLTIRFYQTSDSNTVVTSTSIFNASPGHAYNLLLRGYMNYQSYTDPFTGKLLNVNADLKAVVTQNK